MNLTLAAPKLLLPAALLGAAIGAAPVHLLWKAKWSTHQAKDTKELARAEAAARRMEQAGAAIAGNLRDRHDQKQQEIRYVTTTTLKAIPVYIPQTGGVGGVPVEQRDGTRPVQLTVGFGRLHDYAALGIPPPVPAPSGQPLGAASGIGLPELAETIVANYGVSHADSLEVRTWRAWYVAQKAAWDANRTATGRGSPEGSKSTRTAP